MFAIDHQPQMNEVSMKLNCVAFEGDGDLKIQINEYEESGECFYVG